MGKEGLRALEGIAHHGDCEFACLLPSRVAVLLRCGSRTRHGRSLAHLLHISSDTCSPAGSNDKQPDPDRPPGSDLSSLGPSQSASQIFLPISPLELAADHDQTYSPSHVRSPPASSPTPVALEIPPAHAISEFTLPPARMGLDRRITEETEEEESSSEDDTREVQVVENTRFASASASQSRLAPENGNAGGSKIKRFSLRTHKRDGSGTTSSATGTGSFIQPPQNDTPQRPTHGPRLRLTNSRHRESPSSTPTRERKGSGFFGSLAGLFRTGGGGGGGSDGKWKTRTAQNLKSAQRAGDSDSEDDEAQAKDEGPSRWPFGRRASDDIPQQSPKRKLKRNGTLTSNGDARQSQDTGWISDGGAVPGAGARKGSLRGKGSQPMQQTSPIQSTKASSSSNLPLRSTSTRATRSATSPVDSGTSAPRSPRTRTKSDLQDQQPRYRADIAAPSRVEILSGRNGDLSRQGSLRSNTSAASAPVGNVARQTTTRRSASTSRAMANGIPPSRSTPFASANGSSLMTQAKSKPKAGTWSGAHPDVGKEGQPSLMSIVEGVARDNRAGWDRSSHGIGAIRNGASSAGGLVGVRAPPPVSQYNLRGESGRGIPYETVFMPAGSAYGKAPEATLSRSPSAASTRGPRDRTSVPVQRANTISAPQAQGSPSSRPAKSPLRSALRNPSPPPVPPPPPVKPMVLPTAPPKVVPDATESDASSISSYATGREAFDEEEDVPPAPPSKDHASSDLSASTIDAGGPTRRKSVRMSLNPTFSPTPPAVDDDDDDVWRMNGNGRPNGKANGGFKGGEDEGDVVAVGVWEDSSSEDEEYARAKSMLKKVGRKKRW
ncbi:hypothetical protein BV25DRAFT_1822238 [Artomyces pyxidatus]|uniref:Uncharacterized protein n=1 Tax=Artomyces pyxidatus TaxID=48021 RepID=A0ACB8T9D8_9AGAM|nr:hypothetical protein BV25DRAFT_1822238 [Artomyces pyxidatus]